MADAGGRVARLRARATAAREQAVQGAGWAADTAERGAVALAWTVLYLALVAVFLAVLLGAAVWLYSLLYYFMIPSVVYTAPVHLVYPSGGGVVDGGASLGLAGPAGVGKATGKEAAAVSRLVRAPVVANVSIAAGSLAVGTAYDLVAYLTLPETPSNRDAGVFMVSAVVHDAEGGRLAASARPSMLQYSSLVRRQIWALIGAFLPLDLGIQAQRLRVVLVERLEVARHGVPANVAIGLSSAGIQTYPGSTIAFEAQFRGLRYYMYHWFLTTAAVCVGVIFLFEAGSSLVLASVVAALVWSGGGEPDRTAGHGAGVDPLGFPTDDAPVRRGSERASMADTGAGTTGVGAEREIADGSSEFGTPTADFTTARFASARGLQRLRSVRGGRQGSGDPHARPEGGAQGKRREPSLSSSLDDFEDSLLASPARGHASSSSRAGTGGAGTSGNGASVRRRATGGSDGDGGSVGNNNGGRSTNAR